jgi:hypothetical protein
VLDQLLAGRDKRLVGDPGKRPSSAHPAHATGGQFLRWRYSGHRQDIDRGADLANHPSNVSELDQPGSIDDISPSPPERDQPGDRVIEIVRVIQVVLRSGRDDKPMGPRGFNSLAHSVYRHPKRQATQRGVVILGRAPSRAGRCEQLHRAPDAAGLARVARLGVHTQRDGDRRGHRLDVPQQLITANVLIGTS